MRKYGKWLLVLGILAANPAWVSADGFLDGLRPQSRTAERQANQQKAEQVAQALKQARLNGYDLEVEVRGDIVKLDGKVRDVTHRALAERVSKQVTGINRIQKGLRRLAQKHRARQRAMVAFDHACDFKEHFARNQHTEKVDNTYSEFEIRKLHYQP